MNLVTLVTLGLPFHNEEEGVSDQSCDCEDHLYAEGEGCQDLETSGD